MSTNERIRTHPLGVTNEHINTETRKHGNTETRKHGNVDTVTNERYRGTIHSLTHSLTFRAKQRSELMCEKNQRNTCLIFRSIGPNLPSVSFCIFFFFFCIFCIFRFRIGFRIDFGWGLNIEDSRLRIEYSGNTQSDCH